LRVFAIINIHEAKAVVANHVQPTQRVIVTSRIRPAHAFLRHAKSSCATPVFHLFYFISRQMCGRPTNYCVLYAYPSRRCVVIIVSIKQPDVPYFTLYCCLCIAKLQTNRCDICIQYPSFSWNLRNRCIRFRYFVLLCMVLQYVNGAWKKNCLPSIEWKFIDVYYFYFIARHIGLCSVICMAQRMLWYGFCPFGIGHASI